MAGHHPFQTTQPMERLPFLNESFADTVADGNIAILDNVLGLSVVGDVLTEAQTLLEQQRLHPAGMGRLNNHHQNVDYRGDQICWIDPQQAGRGMDAVYSLMEQIRCFMNEWAFLGLRDFELQLARYPGHGERYGKHRDAFFGSKTRVITAIYYLNTSWTAECGGQLSATTVAGDQLIAPIADRLVVFRSDAVEHEVLASYAPRWALTGWFRTQTSTILE